MNRRHAHRLRAAGAERFVLDRLCLDDAAPMACEVSGCGPALTRGDAVAGDAGPQAGMRPTAGVFSSANLAALCQRCHILHDKAEHLRPRRLTYLARRALGDLFTGPYGSEAAC